MYFTIKKQLFAILLIASSLFVCVSSKANTGNDPWPVFKYATPYDYQSFIQCSQYKVGMETTGNEYTADCDCFPIKDFNVDNTTYRLCEADWAGDTDLWIIKCRNKTCEKPLLTPYSEKKVKQCLCEHNDVCDLKEDTIGDFVSTLYEHESVIANKISFIKSRDLLKIGLWLTKHGKIKDKKHYLNFNFDMDVIKTDSDKDGLTNILEDAIGTEAYNKDTDFDGIYDSEDSNPLVSDKTIDTDESKIYSAAFNDQYYSVKNKLFTNVYEYDFDGAQYPIKNNEVLFVNYRFSGYDNEKDATFHVHFKNLIFIDANNATVEVFYHYYALVGRGIQYTMIKKDNNWEVTNKKVILVE